MSHPVTTMGEVKDLQQAFKHAVLVRVARKIVETALLCGEVWPDDYSIAEIANRDKNCVGGAYNWLEGAKVIYRDRQSNRPSTAENAHGRTIFKWMLANRELAETFLRRNPLVEMAEPMPNHQPVLLA